MSTTVWLAFLLGLSKWFSLRLVEVRGESPSSGIVHLDSCDGKRTTGGLLASGALHLVSQDGRMIEAYELSSVSHILCEVSGIQT